MRDVHVQDDASLVIAAGAARRRRRHGDCQSNGAEGYTVRRIRSRQDVYIPTLC